MALTTINSDGVKDDSIVNADIKSDAAIAGSKVAPDFGSQNIITTGNVGIGTGSGTSTPLHVVGSDNTTTLLVESTDADASVGPIIELFRNSGSPADNDAIGRIDFKCDDDAGNASSFARIAVTALDVSNGSEDAKIDFIAATNDTFTPTMSITGQKVGIGTDSPSNKLHCVSSDYQTARFESSAADANGTYIEMYANSSSPADNDILGIVSFRGNNSAAEQMAYAHVRAIATDVTDGTEDGAILFHTRSNGSFGERLRITSDGNIGFNRTNVGAGDSSTQNSTATPNRFVFNNDYSSGYTDASLKVYLFNDGGTRHGFTSGPAYDLQYHSSGHATNAKHTFFTENAERLRITSGGISFNGDSAAANALDDYEEGTWTPTLEVNSLTGETVVLMDGGRYTKVGNRVWGQAYIKISNIGSGASSSAAVYIGGLPFTSGSGHQNAVVHYWSTTTQNYTTITATVQASNDKILLRRNTAAASNITNMPYSDLATDTTFVVSFHYDLS